MVELVLVTSTVTWSAVSPCLDDQWAGVEGDGERGNDDGGNKGRQIEESVFEHLFLRESSRAAADCTGKRSGCLPARVIVCACR